MSSFTSIPSTIIAIGKAVTKNLWDIVKNNFDDMEARLNATEAAAGKIYLYNGLIRNAGQYASNSTLEGLRLFQLKQDIKLTEAKITTIKAGSSGSTEMDILFCSTATGVFESVFNTKPSVPYSAGDGAESTNADWSTTELSAGTWVRIDISSFQDPQYRFHFDVIAEPS